MTAYYNENDPKAAAWLRELIKAGLISKGEVDERSIVDVRGSDLAGFTRCHFFAGIGGWDYALRLAGWPPDEPVWTGSCPCQPFSQAGKGKGESDSRHLWPDLLRPIEECRPSRIFGEQVASKAGRRWLDGVRADLEALDHEVGAADLCSPGVGAPHIRQRLYWVAQPHDSERRTDLAARHKDGGSTLEEYADQCAAGAAGSSGGLGNATGDNERREWEPRASERRDGASGGSGSGSDPVERMVISDASGRKPGRQTAAAVGYGSSTGPAGRDGFWDAFEIVHCTDDKARRIEPGTFPLAHGVPARMGRLRGYGNAINPWLTAEFIAAYMSLAQGLRLEPAAGNERGY